MRAANPVRPAQLPHMYKSGWADRWAVTVGRLMAASSTAVSAECMALTSRIDTGFVGIRRGGVSDIPLSDILLV